MILFQTLEQHVDGHRPFLGQRRDDRVSRQADATRLSPLPRGNLFEITDQRGDAWLLIGKRSLVRSKHPHDRFQLDAPLLLGQQTVERNQETEVRFLLSLV